MVVACKVGDSIYQLSKDGSGCSACAFYEECKLENPVEDIMVWCEYTAKLMELKGRRAWLKAS